MLLENLISAGTGICGGSAVAAIAPVIDADDKDIAFAMSSTFLFDMVMIALYPLMGKALAAIGLNTSLLDFKKACLKPMFYGVTIDTLVTLTALVVIWCMGLM